jgi:hypothetical protein
MPRARDCGGPFDEASRCYRDDVAVTAVPVQRPALGRIRAAVPGGACTRHDVVTKP